MAYCVTKQKQGKQPIDLHTLTFVALHELTHVLTVEADHPHVFWVNFKFVLQAAKDAGVHDPINYREQPTQYCGMTVDDNPYYNDL